MSRLAKWRKVLFIEEPWHTPNGAPFWERSNPSPGVTVCRLHTPSPAPGFHDEHIETFTRMLPALLAEEQADQYIAWLYTPMALPLARTLDPQAVVYDCMDELAAFAHAPPELLEREQQLLAWSDLVFTGGPSLYRAKRDRHPSVRCFPSSVDAAHFRQARAGIAEPADQAQLPHPRLGFYGVIDERFDIPLLDALAQAHPEWQFMIVGPVVKIDPATLPRHPNIHYTGQRSYAELPAYLAGWDVCLLPFARNESTRFISPTKTIEYMAAELPIVSTPIADVAEPYGDIVYLGDTPAAFIAACERALAEAPAERERRRAGMRAVLARTSWDATARDMQQLIEQAIAAHS
jgi:UDP-galactopyranose mutase